MVFEQRSESEARHIEKLGRHHRIKEAVRVELAEVVEQAEVEVAAMHDQVLGGEAAPESVERQRREQIDQENLLPRQNLQKAHPRPVAEEIVGLGIDRDLLHPVQGVKQRRQQRGLVDKSVGRSRVQSYGKGGEPVSMLQRGGIEQAKVRSEAQPPAFQSLEAIENRGWRLLVKDTRLAVASAARTSRSRNRDHGVGRAAVGKPRVPSEAE